MVEKNDTPHINVDYFEDLTGEIKVERSGSSEQSVGERIKNLREEKGVSLDKLAELTGFSKEQLSAFETGQAQPQLGAVMKLSSALDTVFGKLLSGEGKKSFSIIRKETLVPFDRSATDGAKKVYSYYSLGSDVKDRNMEPLIVYLEENPEEKMSAHEGEEFIHVLEGNVTLKVENERYQLEPGDSVYYHSNVPHMVAATKGRAVILAVLYE